ncbi:unnamed protein product [Rotaria sp. Silwood2]|nr:unnamed protein product [Rotaria sp. Silwood2]CAF4776300.1 unnamed protein product [Rotaria sp. Silwood2]
MLESDDQWQKQPVLIAVVGRTGGGKSTLIRRLLDMQPDDDGEPLIGSGNDSCTSESKEYPKSGTGLVYIDVPGVGSTEKDHAFTTPVEQKNYSARFKLQNIDYFLLVFADKLQDHEARLIRFITDELKKSVSVIQTKVDAKRREHATRKLEQKYDLKYVKDKFRREIQEILDTDLKNIFLLSNDACSITPDNPNYLIYDRSPDYEFNDLMDRIQKDMLGKGGLTAEKGKAFILATGAVCESAVRAKANALRNQSWGWGTLSGVIGTIPIPGVSLTCDAAIVVNGATNYCNAFGLSPLRYIGEGTSTEKIKRLGNTMIASMGSRAAIIFGLFVGLNTVEENVKVVPVIGSVAGSLISFTTTCQMLRLLIDFCEGEALAFLQNPQTNSSN